MNHLHDCILCSPIDVDTVFSVITDAYCRPEMKTLASKLIFSQFKSTTRGSLQKKIVKIEKEFISNMDNLDFLNVTDFDARRCYKFEGA